MSKIKLTRARAMRTIAAVVACIAAVSGALAVADAQASIPSWEDRVDAKKFARAYWAKEYGAYTRCSGVRMRWRNYWEDGNVRKSLAYQLGCTVTFNKQMPWGYMRGYGWGDDWWRLCVTAIHEYGHLPGMPFDGRHGPIHSRNPNHMMAGSEGLSAHAWWWPHHPWCRYQGDDKDGDDLPDYRART